MSFNPQLSKAIDRIGRLSRAVEELALLPQRVAREAAPKLDRLVKQQFARGVDPYGKAWKPIKLSTRRRRVKASRGAPPLTNTRKLRSGTGVSATRAGAKLVLGAPWGYFAQVGTKFAPARRIFPQFGIPAPWRQILRDVAREERKKILARSA
jgi:hypothetical protein